MAQYDLIIVGAGSGGMGAAITAAREGMNVLWIEQERVLGGTGVHAYVNVWQPAYSASSLASEICQRLYDRGAANFSGPDTNTPMGRPVYRPVPASYEDTLGRWTNLSLRLLAPAVVYTPDGMDAILREMIAESGHIELWDQSTFLDAHRESGRITALEVQTPQGRKRISAPCYIDATANIHLARKAGCAYQFGRESRSQYDEPSAPEQPEFRLNGWTLCFLAAKGEDRLTGKPGEGPDSSWAHIGELPGGGLYVNMVFQLPGEVGWSMGMELARDYLMGNIFKRWPLVKEAYGLYDYGIAQIAPRIGVREGPRLVGRYVLTEHDFRRGEFGRHHEDCIAFCDHAMDSHLPGEGCTEAPQGPFGVPFRCLQPREVDNLLVASRGASFSSLAASACRLQRTMIELGEAAGWFAATGKVRKPTLPPYQPWQ